MRTITLLFLLLVVASSNATAGSNNVNWLLLNDDHRVNVGEYIGVRVSYDSPNIPITELIHKVPSPIQEGQHKTYPGSNLLAGNPTVAEIRSRLSEHLSRRPPLPQTISVYELTNIQGVVLVHGMVNRPGSAIITDKDLTVIEAIKQCGGISRLACGDSLRIQRIKSDGTKKLYELDFDKILKGENTDFILKDGDIILVPERICI